MLLVYFTNNLNAEIAINRMTTFLALASTYDSIEIALFQDASILEAISIDKIRASKDIIVKIQQLLTAHALSLTSLSFIAVNQGPAPFTTLRVVITTANGINFAQGTPLIGVDALDAFLIEYADKNKTTVALFNAFNGDAYFGIMRDGIVVEKGCLTIESLLQHIQTTNPDNRIVFIGNGVALFKNQIEAMLGTQSLNIEVVPSYPSIKQLGLLGLDHWQKNLTTTQLLPLYLKQFKVFGR